MRGISKSLAVLAFAVLTACGQSPESSEKNSADAASKARPAPSRPDPMESFHQPILQMLDHEMSEVVHKAQVANISYVLIKDGQLVTSGFHGKRTLGGDDAVDDKTLYRIYSMTKPVTAVALLMLYEEGNFSLDDPVSKFIPEFSNLKVLEGVSAGQPRTRPASRAPTMRELLLHTAGFGYGDGKRDYVTQQFIEKQIMDAPTSDELIKRVASVPLMYEPGTAWSYSIASDIQGVIIERISGQSLGDFMQKRIFDPLAMNDTGFHTTPDKEYRLASLTGWTPETPLALLPGTIQTMRASEVTRHSGGHGLLSTIDDFERFSLMLLGEGTLDGVQILKPETVGLIAQNGLHFVNEQTGLPLHRPYRGVGYGFGVGVIDDTIASGLAAPEGTYFWEGAAGTWFWIDPRHDLIFIGMIQNTSSSPIMLRRSAMQRVYHALITDYFPGVN